MDIANKPRTGPQYLRQVLLKQLAEGRLRAEERILPLRELSRQFGVAYPSAQKVVAQLCREGYLEPRGRAGTFVTGKRPERITRETDRILFVVDKELHTLPGSRLNHFYLEILNAAEEQSRTGGCYLVYMPIDRQFNLQTVDAITKLGEGRGVLLVGEMMDRGLAFLLRERGLNVVLVDNAVDGFNSVVVDPAPGVQEAVAGLVQLGHRRFGFLGGSANETSVKDKVSALNAAVQKQNLPQDGLRIYLDTNPGQLSLAVREIMAQPQPPTVLLTATDYEALTVLRVLDQLGLSVPRDISVIGFDDVEWGRQSVPALSTIGVDKAAMGRWAVEKLLADPDEICIHTITTHYIPRQTTGRLQEAKI